MIAVHGVPPLIARQLWPRCWSLLRKVVKRFPDMHGPKTSDDVLAALERGETQLWLAWEGKRITGAAITRLLRSDLLPGKLLCDFDYWAGENMKAWGQAMFLATRAWADRQGCDLMTWTGRRGWLRLFGGYQFGTLPNGKPAFARVVKE